MGGEHGVAIDGVNMDDGGVRKRRGRMETEVGEGGLSSGKSSCSAVDSHSDSRNDLNAHVTSFLELRHLQKHQHMLDHTQTPSSSSSCHTGKLDSHTLFM